MNRRDLLKKLGLGGAVAAAAAVAPKVPETVAQIIDPSGKLPIELQPAPPPIEPIGGVPGAIRHLVRERAHGRPMGYMESEDGSLVHWHATDRGGNVITGTVDRENPNFAGKNGLAYYAMKNGVRYENPGKAQADKAARALHSEPEARAHFLSDQFVSVEPLELEL